MVLKVLHVICDLAGGGAERLVLDLCRHARDVAPEVATVHDGGALAPAFQAAGVRVRSAGRVRGRAGARALARLVGLAREVDVVHTHLWAGDVWGGLAARLAGRPQLCTEHNSEPDAPWRGRLAAALEPELVVGVGLAAARLRGRGPEAVVPNGVDLSRFVARASAAGPARRVLAVGRLLPQKGFDVLVEAMRALPDLELDLVGEGPERPRLAGPNVRLHGWQADVRPFLAAADIVVIPSRWEGFGLVAVEAMASGVPVIASAIPGLDEAVGDAAIRVPPEDPAALASALRALAADPLRRAALAGAGRAQAARFDIHRAVATYESMYRRLADGRARE